MSAVLTQEQQNKLIDMCDVEPGAEYCHTYRVRMALSDAFQLGRSAGEREERERCAKLAEDKPAHIYYSELHYSKFVNPLITYNIEWVCKQLAAAIRGTNDLAR